MSHVLYLENDEDITSTIDKLNKSTGTEVRVVVPKRSNLLSSLINLKLLKKAAKEAHKKLVIVTTDKTIINLASRVDVAVAHNVNAHAEIPDADKIPEDKSEIVEEEPEEKPADSQTEPVSDKTEASAMAGAALEMTHRPAPEDKPDEESKSKPKRGKKIPDFGSFQKRMWLAAGVVGVALLLFGLNYYFKQANITVFAQGNQTPSTITFKGVTDGPADPKQTQATQQTLSDSKTISNSFTATGQKDVGTKASGTVTIKNCEDTAPHPLPAGATVSANGKNFLTQTPVNIPAGTFSGGGSNCTTGPTASTGVTAAANGDSYNLAPTSYTSPSLTSNFKITGNQMSGGTTKNITVVTQADVDAAKSKLSQPDDTVKNALASKAKSDQIAAKDTFAVDVSGLNANPAVDGEASTFTLAGPVKYSLQAFNKKNLEDLIQADVNSKIGQNNVVYDFGLAGAKITPNPTAGQFDLKTTVYAGPRIDTDNIKKQVSGKKLGQAGTIIEQMPGVDKANISLTPFWSTNIPRIKSHIKIDIKVSNEP